MGLLSRRLVPRSVRRAAHPVRTAKSAITPKPVKQLRRVLNPIDTAVYIAERALTTKPRVTRKPYWTHGSCPVKHRTPEAAQKCRN